VKLLIKNLEIDVGLHAGSLEDERLLRLYLRFLCRWSHLALKLLRESIEQDLEVLRYKSEEEVEVEVSGLNISRLMSEEGLGETTPEHENLVRARE